MAVKKTAVPDLPDANLYAQEASYAVNPLNEAPFVIFPKRDGLLVHKKSGVAFQPTWRGMTAAGTLLVLEEELKLILAQKDEDGNAVWVINPNERPFDPARATRMQEAQQEAPAQPKSNNVTQFTQASGATRPRNELDNVFEADAMTEGEIKIWTQALQADLDKNPKTQGQTVAVVDAVKVIKSKKNGVALLFGGTEVIAAFDNRISDEDAEWKNPIAKLPDGLRLDYSTAQNGVIFKLSEPMFVAIKANGDFRNFQRVLRFEGKWSVA